MKYGNKVKIKKGFYEGLVGELREEIEAEKEYYVSFGANTGFIIKKFKIEDLELIKDLGDEAELKTN